MKLPSAVLGALEIGLNEYVAGDTQALARCAELQGRSLTIHLSDWNLEFNLLAHAHGLQVMETLESIADVRLSAPAQVFAKSLFARDNASIIGAGLRIEGDVGLAQQFAAMFEQVDLDIEDWLEPRIGDVPAHLLGRVLRGASGFARRAAQNLSLDAAEYLREETRDLVHRQDIEKFSHGVDTLRTAADRLAARVRRLEQANS